MMVNMCLIKEFKRKFLLSPTDQNGQVIHKYNYIVF